MVSRPHGFAAQPSRPTTAAYSSLKPCTPGAWLGETCGPFHSTPSSRTAASATAARLVALRISRRTAVLAQVSCSFCIASQKCR